MNQQVQQDGQERHVILQEDQYLLAPVCSKQPCGPNLENDQAFVLLQAAVAPRGDVQYGSFVSPACTVDWQDASQQCRALLLRTRDIRVLVILMRARLHLQGAAGFAAACAALLAVLRQFPDTVHPSDDPVLRHNALQELMDPDGLLGELHQLRLPEVDGVAWRVGDVARAYMVPLPHGAAPPDVAQRMLARWQASGDATVCALKTAARITEQLLAWRMDQDPEAVPDLMPLVRLLSPFGLVLPAGGSQDVTEPECGQAAAGTAPDTGQHDVIPVPAGTAQLASRTEAIAAMRAARIWFEQAEPSSPVPVLLAQAERMVGRRFTELVTMLPADLLAQWDRAGNTNSSS